MADSTLWALVASISLLSAISMAAFAYRLNEKWAERDAEWAEICDKQNKMLETMNEDWANHCNKISKEWAEFYKIMMEDKHDC